VNNEYDYYEELFRQKFARVEQEVHVLHNKITMKQGVWVFQRHVYSVQEMLTSEHYEKIYSISQKIGHDVMQWVRQGALPDEGKEAYRKARDRVARQLGNINHSIQERKPTQWEKWLAVFQDFTTIVLRLLPTLARIIKVTKKLLQSAEEEDRKLLPPPKPI